MNRTQADKVKRLGAVSVVAGALAATVGIGAAQGERGAPAADAAKKIQLEDASVIVEVNDTEGDAGLQFFLDGEPWNRMKVSMPGGKKLIDLKGTGKLKNWGLTESFHETNEPEFAEVPLSKFKKRFPAGTYRFAGRTIEGQKLVGKAKLSHDIPAGPTISSPAADSTVPLGDVEADWAPVPVPGTEITGWRVIVERENPLRVFQVELPASTTNVTVPAEYFESGVEYLIEIQAIDRSGNWSFSEHHFRIG